MKRQEFLRSCGFACLGGSLLGLALGGCSGSRTISGRIEGSDLVVPVNIFVHKDGMRRYAIVQHDSLRYPICIYRFGPSDYAALLLRCPHQGAELQVFGSRMQCPAHGSEFNDHGIVENGPATSNLRRFPVTVQNQQLYISLK